MTGAGQQRRARIGVIGAGWWAALNHIPVVQGHPDAEIAGVSRLGRAELERLTTEFAIPYGTEDPAMLLADVALDGVIVASPHVLHAEHALLSLRAGKHVLLEKPSATSAGDARLVQATARGQGLGLMVPHAWNYKSYASRARELMAAGGIGEVRHVVCQMASPLADLMAGLPMRDTEGHFFRPPPSTWATPGSAGGYGWGQLTHALGLLAFITSEMPPVEVTATTGLSTAGVDYYDAAFVRFANGATGVLSGSSTAPKGSPFQLDIRLFGTEGMLLLDIERERLLLRRHDAVDTTVEIKPGEGAPDGVAPVHRFIDLCLGRLAPADVRPFGAIIDIEILDALYRSASSGMPEAV